VVDRLVFVAVPLDSPVALLQLALSEIVPDEVVRVDLGVPLLDLEEVLVGHLPAGNPAGVVLEVNVVPVVDVLHGGIEAGSLDACPSR
jgi:hypothetical protein